MGKSTILHWPRQLPKYFHRSCDFFFFLIPCWTERETCMVFFPFWNAEFIWSRLCLHIFLGVHTSMGLHNNMALPVRCHTLWGYHVSCGLRFGESTSSSSILWMVMPKIPNLELVFYPSPSSHFWMPHWDTSSHNVKGPLGKPTCVLCHFHISAGRAGGPAQAGSPRNHPKNKLDSEQSGHFLLAVFSPITEGIPDLPGGTKAVILKGWSLDQRHQHHLQSC